MTASGNFEHFQYFNSDTIFLENENLLQKTGSFLVLVTKIENTTFSYKTPLPEANDKTNRWGSTKWTYHKEQSFASKYFIFLKILAHFKNIL